MCVFCVLCFGVLCVFFVFCVLVFYVCFLCFVCLEEVFNLVLHCLKQDRSWLRSWLRSRLNNFLFYNSFLYTKREKGCFGCFRTFFSFSFQYREGANE